MTASLDEARRFVRLARDDLAAFQVLVASPQIRKSLAFFHAQQAMEKSLKAVLFARSVSFRKTHDLYALAELLNASGISAPSSSVELASINPYAVESRYGDEVTSTLSAAEVDAMAVRLVDWAGGVVASFGD
jgi:HEPN domain-containing protein